VLREILHHLQPKKVAIGGALRDHDPLQGITPLVNLTLSYITIYGAYDPLDFFSDKLYTTDTPARSSEAGTTPSVKQQLSQSKSPVIPQNGPCVLQLTIEPIWFCEVRITLLSHGFPGLKPH
jgi:hypothetical protein